MTHQKLLGQIAGVTLVPLLLVGCGGPATSISPAATPTPVPQKSQPVPEPAPIYTELRNRVLTLEPNEVGIVQSEEIANVWGVLMEFVLSEAVVTLVSLADGTTSLYFGNGSGIIGGGEHASVAKASKTLVSNSEKYFKSMTPTTSFPLPSVGRVKFYILTFSGTFTADIDENELGEGKHDLSPLFYSGQKVITQIRLIEEQKK